jgi:hypothetical protein
LEEEEDEEHFLFSPRDPVFTRTFFHKSRISATIIPPFFAYL